MAMAGEGTSMVMVVVTLWMVTYVSTQALNDDDGIILDPEDNLLYESCSREGKPGMCVHDYQCLRNHTLAIGGDLALNAPRSGSGPPKKCGRLWCCMYPKNYKYDDSDEETPPPTAAGGRSCTRVSKECPWCVALYREGGNVALRHRTASGRYCAGSLVSPRVVVTSATCVRTVQAETVRARLPDGEEPGKYYTVVDSLVHPDYASGNHTSDFALMVLNEDVKSTGEACMEFKAPRGECRVLGFSSSDEIVMTKVSVRDGPCRRRRGGGFGEEVACGEAEGQCAAAYGAPLLCPVARGDQGGLSIVGVVRMHCISDKVLLGKIQQHRNWLTRELKNLGVEPVLYQP